MSSRDWSKLPAWRHDALESPNVGAPSYAQSQSSMPRFAARDAPSSSPSFSSSSSSPVSPQISTARQRLSSVSRHLNAVPYYEINTPYSIERQSVPEDEFDAEVPEQFRPVKPTQKDDSEPKMSTQAPHPLVMVPGPIEYDDEVLKSMSHFRSVVRCLCSDPFD